jgi:alkylhydroperoxidase/carboxymuconolactone decarboxylase family protein YurZ
MDQIDGILNDDRLLALRDAYARETMIGVLSKGMPAIDARTTDYISDVRRAFYDSGSPMQPKDRERCLIAVLAARDAGFNLSLHIYLGLMEGLTPQEIADVIFLCGVYTGVDRISDGLGTLVRTLTTLKTQSEADGTLVSSPSCTVEEVLRALRQAFNR